MWYAIICEDVDNSLPLRKKVRPAHLDRLQELKNKDRLLTAGPLPAIDSDDPGAAGFTGSVIIAQFTSLTEAKEWAEQDPYATAGVFASLTVKPYKQVF